VANSQIVTIAQIETLTAIDNIKEIVSTHGLDAVFIGPTDLSVSAGTGPIVNYDDPTTDERHRLIVKEVHAAGLKVGMLTVNPLSRETETVSKWGADLISLGNDISLLRSASAHALQFARRTIQPQQ
jgi:4-hydroxy-2-oxoheptanedioate aldolase